MIRNAPGILERFQQLARTREEIPIYVWVQKRPEVGSLSLDQLISSMIGILSKDGDKHREREVSCQYGAFPDPAVSF